MSTYWIIKTEQNGIVKDSGFSVYADSSTDAIGQAMNLLFTGTGVTRDQVMAEPEDLSRYSKSIRDLTEAEKAQFAQRHPDLPQPDCAIFSDYTWWYGVRDAVVSYNFWERATRAHQRTEGCHENGARYIHGKEPSFFIEVNQQPLWYSANTEVAPWYPPEG